MSVYFWKKINEPFRLKNAQKSYELTLMHFQDEMINLFFLQKESSEAKVLIYDSTSIINLARSSSAKKVPIYISHIITTDHNYPALVVFQFLYIS